MRKSLFNLEGKGEIPPATAAKKTRILWYNSNITKEGVEPRSVLESRRSPSPPVSTSTLSSSLGSSTGAGVTGVPEDPYGNGGRGGEKEICDALVHPIPASLEKCGLEGEWGSLEKSGVSILFGKAALDSETPFLGCVVGDSDDLSSVVVPPRATGFENDGGCGFEGIDPYWGFPSQHSESESFASGGGFPPEFGGSVINSNVGNPPIFASLLPFSVPQSMSYQANMDEKSTLFGLNNVMLNNERNQQQRQHQENPSPFPPSGSYSKLEYPILPLPPKGYHSMANQLSPSVISSESGQGSSQNHHSLQNFVHQEPLRTKMMGGNEMAEYRVDYQQQQHQALFDQLLKAAEFIEVGNSVNASVILARLNQQLFLNGKPLVRFAFYFKEALCSLIADNFNAPASLSLTLQQKWRSAQVTPLDVVLKISAYKTFCEISPILQFTYFTCIQTILEEVNGFDRIHIVDFDLGVGGQWASFLQELSQRRSFATGSNAILSLRITAVVSSSHHPFEIILARETLSHLASTLRIFFELNILNINSFNPSDIRNTSPEIEEAIAVNIPVSLLYTSTRSFLHVVQDIRPKVVVSVDNGCGCSDLSFSQNFLLAMRACTTLLESIEAAGANEDVTNKIEQFIVRPLFDDYILAQKCGVEKFTPWRTLFALSGFTQMPFSNFTETQAECLLKRVQVRGFHVEKKRSSLHLFWQHNELVSSSAWRC